MTHRFLQASPQLAKREKSSLAASNGLFEVNSFDFKFFSFPFFLDFLDYLESDLSTDDSAVAKCGVRIDHSATTPDLALSRRESSDCGAVGNDPGIIGMPLIVSDGESELPVVRCHECSYLRR